jgi:hypothetical protein
MEPLKQHDPRVQRVNALYWESQQSVNQIADEMDLSKGMLYGLIQPIGAGLPCPRCSFEMEYANRTARERGFLKCPSCDFEQDKDHVRSELQDADATGRHGELLVTPGPAGLYRHPRDPLLVGVGLLLVAAGIWLFRSLPRR